MESLTGDEVDRLHPVFEMNGDGKLSMAHRERRLVSGYKRPGKDESQKVRGHTPQIILVMPIVTLPMHHQ